MKSQSRLRLRKPIEPELVMPRIKGKPFHCVCGANVFVRIGIFGSESSVYRCNACLRNYESYDG